MFGSVAAVDDIVNTVVDFVRKGDRAHLRALDILPAALYVTDADGFITYCNPACVDFAGRTPTLGQDRWCVTWKLYTDAGDFLPHHQCPMAIAIQTKRAVRGVIAVAARPNGTRVKFLPFPTPVIGSHGELRGAVNMLIAMNERDEPMPGDLIDDVRAWLSRLVEKALATFTIEDIRMLRREMEQELGSQPPRLLH